MIMFFQAKLCLANHEANPLVMYVDKNTKIFVILVQETYFAHYILWHWHVCHAVQLLSMIYALLLMFEATNIDDSCDWCC